MGSFFTPKYRALDSNGDPMNGAKLNFYEPGTSTRQDTYSDEALSSANANPVVADADGHFGRIYMKTDKAYKVVLTDSADVAEWTEDNVDGCIVLNADIATRIAQATSNPLDHGAIGDGVADETTAVQAAIDAATGVVDLLGKTYKCDSQLVVRSGITLKGKGTLDFAACTDADYIKAQGTLGSQILLTSNAAIDATTLSLNSSGLSVGDVLRLKSDANFGGVDGIELVTIATVPNGTSITVLEPIIAGYTTANNAEVKKITTVDDLTFDNIEIIGNTGASGTKTGILLDMTRRARIFGCKFKNIKNFGVRTADSINVHVSKGCVFENGEIGVEIEGTSQYVRVTDSQFTGQTVRCVSVQSTAIVGVIRYVEMSGCEGRGVAQMMRCLNASQYVIAKNNKGTGLLAAAGAAAFDFTSADLECSYNSLRSFGSGGEPIINVNIPSTGAAVAVKARVKIRGNKIARADGEDAISIATSGTAFTWLSVDISGNTIDGCARGIVFAASEWALVNICDNSIHNASATGIYVPRLSTATGIYTINNNTIDMSSASNLEAIEMEDPQNAVISGNSILLGATGTGIRLESVCDNVTVSGNVVIAGGRALHVTLTTTGDLVESLTVNGNAFSQQTLSCLDIDGVDGKWITITGNTFERDAQTNNVIEIGGETASNLTHVNVTGNVFRNGAYAILAANAASCLAGDNIYHNQGTGRISGAGFTELGIELTNPALFATPATALTLGSGVTTFALTSNVMTITGDGGSNTIATITGAVSGMVLTLIFVDANVAITDDGGAGANTTDLSAAFTSANDTVLQLVYDGTSWFEVSRSVN